MSGKAAPVFDKRLVHVDRFKALGCVAQKGPRRWELNTRSQDHRWLGNAYFVQKGAEVQAMARIVAIHAAIPNTHLVMHGSSSVPQEWLQIIRQYGGGIKETNRSAAQAKASLNAQPGLRAVSPSRPDIPWWPVPSVISAS